jgi:hypothetical protein
MKAENYRKRWGCRPCVKKIPASDRVTESGGVAAPEVSAARLIIIYLLNLA